MKKFMLLAIAAMAFLAVSCQKEKDEELPTFTAHADNSGMKASLVGNLIHWNSFDQVMAFDDLGYAIYGASPRDDDPTWATLSPIEAHGFVGQSISCRFVYPARMAEGEPTNDNTLYVTYPDTRNILDSPLDYFPMYGESDHLNVAFRNLGGLVKIMLPEIDKQIAYIGITTDGPICGKYRISSNGDLVYAGENDATDKSVVVYALDRTFAEGDCVYIAMPAGDYHNFTIRIYSEDEVATKVGNMVSVQQSAITTINVSNLVFENREWPAATLAAHGLRNLQAQSLIFHYNYTDAVTDCERIDNGSSNLLSTPIYKKIIDNVCHVYTPASEVYAPANSSYLFAYSYNPSGNYPLCEIDFGDGFNTSNVTNMSSMFSNCISLTSLDLSSFNTSNVTDMCRMFGGCQNLTSLDLSSFNTSNVTDMSYMFSNCISLTSLDLWSFSSNSLTNFGWTFSNCSALQSICFSSSFTLSNSCPTWGALENVGATCHTLIKCNSQTKSRLQNNASPGSGVEWDLY